MMAPKGAPMKKKIKQLRERVIFVPVGFVFPDIVVRICSLIAFHAPFAGQCLGTIRRTTQCLIFSAKV